MNNEENICYFAGLKSKDTYSCGILNVNVCSGKDTNCAFYKTKEKYNANRDKAIDRCRNKDICNDCKYTSVQCVKSSENKR